MSSLTAVQQSNYLSNNVWNAGEQFVLPPPAPDFDLEEKLEQERLEQQLEFEELQRENEEWIEEQRLLDIAEREPCPSCHHYPCMCAEPPEPDEDEEMELDEDVPDFEIEGVEDADMSPVPSETVFVAVTPMQTAFYGAQQPAAAVIVAIDVDPNMSIPYPQALEQEAQDIASEMDTDAMDVDGQDLSMDGLSNDGAKASADSAMASGPGGMAGGPSGGAAGGPGGGAAGGPG